MNKLAAFCCAALALCHAAVAQSLTERITVNFSSPVLVGSTRLPAGACEIQVLRGASNNTIIVFRSENGVSASAVANHFSPAADADNLSSVVRSRRGDDLHIYRINCADHAGYELNQVD